MRGWFGRLRPTVQRRLRIAVPYALMGIVALVVSFVVSDMPYWPYWVPFAVLFILLEFFAVEVNDRMLQSSSVMVAMSAGAYLAMKPGSDAMFGLALMGAFALFTPLDFKERRWFQPVANFGQIVTACAVSGWILDLNLEGLPSTDSTSLIHVLWVSGVAALAYTTVQTILVRYAIKVVFGRDNLEPWSQMPVLFGGQVAMGLWLVDNCSLEDLSAACAQRLHVLEPGSNLNRLHILRPCFARGLDQPQAELEATGKLVQPGPVTIGRSGQRRA